MSFSQQDNVVPFSGGLKNTSPVSLSGGGGDGTMEPMEARIARLETHMQYMQRDIGDIKESQKKTAEAVASILGKVDSLPSKNDLWQWKVQWTAIAIGAVALIVGGIIGGLDWIKLH